MPCGEPAKHGLPLVIESADGSVTIVDAWAVSARSVVGPIAREEVDVVPGNPASVEPPRGVHLFERSEGEDTAKVVNAGVG